MSTLLGIIETLGIILSFALILVSAVLSQIRLRHPRWLALKKLTQAAVAGLITGLVVAFIASLLLNFMLTYVGSHLAHDGYASCLAATGNNICTGSPWDSASFDIYVVGAVFGAGVGVIRHEMRLRAARSAAITTGSPASSLSATISPSQGKPKAHLSQDN